MPTFLRSALSLVACALLALLPAPVARAQDCGLWLNGPASPDLPVGATVSDLHATGGDLYALVSEGTTTRVWRLRAGAWSRLAWDEPTQGRPLTMTTTGNQVAVVTSRQISFNPINQTTATLYAVQTLEGDAWTVRASTTFNLGLLATLNPRALVRLGSEWCFAVISSSRNPATLSTSVIASIYRSNLDQLERIASTNAGSCTIVCQGLPTITSLANYNGNLYVGGNFTSITPTGGTAVPATNIALLSGSNWLVLPNSPNGIVRGMLVENSISIFNTRLVVWGDFTQLGTLPASHIARWDAFNQQWGTLGAGVVGTVSSGLSPAGVVQIQGTGGINDIDYVAVGVTQAGGAPVDGVARWTGSVWQSYGATGAGRLSGDFNSVTNYGGVVVGGSGLAVGTSLRYGVARSTGAAWNYVSSAGTDGIGLAATTHQGAPHIGGTFTRIDGVQASRLARRNTATNSWEPLGSGLDGPVHALLSFGPDLIAAGEFTSAGGAPALRIAAWNGSQWRSLGQGFDGTVRALTVWNGSLVAVGAFSASGATVVRGAARWTGTAWVAIDPALPAGTDVLCAAPLGTSLYIGTAAGLQRSTGGAFAPIGSVNGPVRALFPLLGSLYVGGEFTSVGAPAQNLRRIARYNGTVWSAVGSNALSDFNFGSVNTIFGSDAQIFAAGTFQVAGANGTATNIARFDGAFWRALTSEQSDAPFRAGTLAPGGIWAAGEFTVIGAVPAFGAAQWSETPVFVTNPQAQAVCAGAPQVVMTVDARSAVTPSYRWRRNGTALSDTLRISGTGTSTLTISSIVPGDQGLYDCVITNCSSFVSAPAQLTINQPCGPSDVATTGQVIAPCGDGVLSADDIIVFINWFFVGDPRADVAGQGQVPTPDTLFTADDIIVFISRFFAGC